MNRYSRFVLCAVATIATVAAGLLVPTTAHAQTPNDPLSGQSSRVDLSAGSDGGVLQDTNESSSTWAGSHNVVTAPAGLAPDAQAWTMTLQPDGGYVFTNFMSGRVLAATVHLDGSSGDVVSEPPQPGNLQEWRVVHQSSTTLQLINVATSAALESTTADYLGSNQSQQTSAAGVGDLQANTDPVIAAVHPVTEDRQVRNSPSSTDPQLWMMHPSSVLTWADLSNACASPGILDPATGNWLTATCSWVSQSAPFVGVDGQLEHVPVDPDYDPNWPGNVPARPDQQYLAATVDNNLDSFQVASGQATLVQQAANPTPNINWSNINFVHMDAQEQFDGVGGSISFKQSDEPLGAGVATSTTIAEDYRHTDVSANYTGMTNQVSAPPFNQVAFTAIPLVETTQGYLKVAFPSGTRVQVTGDATPSRFFWIQMTHSVNVTNPPGDNSLFRGVYAAHTAPLTPSELTTDGVDGTISGGISPTRSQFVSVAGSAASSDPTGTTYDPNAATCLTTGQSGTGFRLLRCATTSNTALQFFRVGSTAYSPQNAFVIEATSDQADACLAPLSYLQNAGHETAGSANCDSTDLHQLWTPISGSVTGVQEWENEATNTCLAVSGTSLVLETCVSGSPAQLWGDNAHSVASWLLAHPTSAGTGTGTSGSGSGGPTPTPPGSRDAGVWYDQNLAATADQRAANPTLSTAPSNVTNGYPCANSANPVGTSCGARPLTVGGVTYPVGIGVHAPSITRWTSTPPTCTRFSFAVGLDDEVGDNGRSDQRIDTLVDGVAQTPVYLKADGSSGVVSVNYPLTDGSHTVEIDSTPTQGPTANGSAHIDILNPRMTCLQAATQQGLSGATTQTIDDSDTAAWTYDGQWTHAALSGFTGGDVMNTESYSNNPGDSATLTFTGTGVRLRAAGDQNRGMFDALLDGQPLNSGVSEYTPGRTEGQSYLTASGLAYGKHTLTLVVDGRADPRANDHFVQIDDAVVATNPDYDDSDLTAWSYTGPWTHASGQTSTAGDTGNTESYVDVAGASASVTFSGTGATVYAPFAYNRGYATIAVDGVVQPGTYSEYASNTTYHQVLFNLQGLPRGPHVITITATGTAPAGSADTYVAVDDLQVTAG